MEESTKKEKNEQILEVYDTYLKELAQLQEEQQKIVKEFREALDQARIEEIRKELS